MEVRAPIWSEHGPLIFIGFSKLQFIQPPPWIFPIHIALLRAAEPLEAGVTRGKYLFTQSVCGLLLSTLPPPRSCPWLVLVLLIHWNVGLLSSLPAASQKHHSLPKNRDPLAGTVALDPQTFLTLLNECRNCLASLCMLWSWGAFEGWELICLVSLLLQLARVLQNFIIFFTCMKTAVTPLARREPD